MRRIVLAVLILILPTATAVVVYLIVNKKVPTNREAIGRVTVIAGTGQPGVDDRPALSATFSDPFGVAVDKRGNLFISDAGQSNRIRRIHPDGRVESVAGSAEGFADGNAAQTQFNTPSGIVIDTSGNIFVADTSNNRIRKIDTDRKVTTLAGSGRAGFKDGSGGEAEFDGPIGIALDKRGDVIVADAYNDRIRRITEEGTVTTIAGAPGFSDGNASIAQFNTPSGVAVDGAGNVFVADTGNSALRKITPQGEVSTVIRDRQESGGRPVSLKHPVGIAITHDGFLFVSHESGVLKITPDGVASEYAGGEVGFADGLGSHARFNGLAGIAIDREGNLLVADTHNYLIREIAPETKPLEAPSGDPSIFVQPDNEARDETARPMIPRLDASVLGVGAAFPWPLQPQGEAHEVTGVIGEARGAAGGIALDHLHSGLDVRGNQGDPVLSVLDEKVSSPVATWDYGGGGEGIQINAMSYIHVRIGRNANDEIQSPDKFRLMTSSDGAIFAVRVRRGARFSVGDLIGTVNRLFHVHLNLGPWNAQTNPLVLPFANLKDTTPPTIEPNGIEIVNAGGVPFTRKLGGRLQISGDARILVSAYDRVDGNAAKRKLGLFRLGYQVVHEDGTPAPGFEQPLLNIQFDRLPPDDTSVLKVYAAGSGVSAYGTPTEFKYIVTNRVRDGQAREGLFRTSKLQPGNYLIKILAEDHAGNRASGGAAETAVSVVR